MPPLRKTLAALAAVALGLSTARAEEPKFKKHDINPKSEFESAGVFDVDNDGDLDIVSGDTWYEAPDWKTHHVRDVDRTGTYLNCFSTLPVDVNGDGKTDFISCSYFGKNVGWVENPGDKDSAWTYHEIDLPGPSEAAVLVDLTGDKVPEILPNVVNTIAWYQVQESGSEPTIKKFDFGNEAAGHGVGTGDINRDGRTDLLTPKGWFEAPEKPESQPWTWHPEWNLGATGIQILGRDVDGDDDTDLVFGMGHNYRPLLGRARAGRQRQTHVDPQDDRRHDCLGSHPALGRPRRRRQGDGTRHRQARVRPRDRARGDRRLGRRLVRLRPAVEGLAEARHLSGRTGQERSRERPRVAAPRRTSPPAPPAPAWMSPPSTSTRTATPTSSAPARAASTCSRT